MKITTRAPATSVAILPASMESRPRPGPTTRRSTTVNFAGSAPARSSTERSLAWATVKLPVIWPEPPVIGVLMRGAETTSLSSTIAMRRPTFSEVACPKRWAPFRLNLKLTIGS